MNDNEEQLAARPRTGALLFLWLTTDDVEGEVQVGTPPAKKPGRLIAEQSRLRIHQ